MGTLMWYDADQNNRLFRETLAKLEPYLKSVDFRGDVDINCIVNEQGAFPLEVTARFGYPAFQLQTEIHASPWGEFLKAVADGRDYDLQWREGVGLVALVATPPFPYFSPAGRKDLSPRGFQLRFRRPPAEQDWDHLHPEEVSRRVNGSSGPEYLVAGDTGYVLHVSAFGVDIEAARNTLYTRLNEIVLPRMYYRDDLGRRFMERDRARLSAWGYA
jgi:phosphoribosylamine--glycine ligase